jgi:phage baseplate assembly protein V
MVILAGKVSSADAETGFVRVAFADRNHAVSGPLPVLAAAGWAQGNALPEVGQNVLCVFPNGSLREGFCLGTYWSTGNAPPGDAGQYGVWFPDGSHVYYDRGPGQLRVKAASGVHIEGNLTVSGSITRGGEVI